MAQTFANGGERYLAPKFEAFAQASPPIVAEISVMVRHDERDYLEGAGRCDRCGHLEALHQIVNASVVCPLCEVCR